jgi:hypothetical protein
MNEQACLCHRIENRCPLPRRRARQDLYNGDLEPIYYRLLSDWHNTKICDKPTSQKFIKT